MRIELENLSKRFDDGRDVLKDLHFADRFTVNFDHA